MKPNCCHVSLGFVLKVLNFLQAFVGVSIIIYSVWMLDQWNHRIPVAPPPVAPSPSDSSLSLLPDFSLRTGLRRGAEFDDVTPLILAADLASGLDNGLGFELSSIKLPAPWFIYSFMGVGVGLCCITLLGCIAAEAINGCCLCFYTILTAVLILLEAVLVAFIAIDHHWDKDLPFDPTGELESLRSFVEENVDICKWVGISVVIIQGLSLLLAFILRGMVSTRRSESDDEDDFENARGRTPLLNPQSVQTDRATHSDIWSSRIREKYGLSSGGNYDLLSQTASGSMKSK